MAYKMRIPGVSRLRLNIDSAVGFGGANRKDDVMLVQFLLRLWGSEHYGPRTPRTPEEQRNASGPVEARMPIQHFFAGFPKFQSYLPAVDGNCDGVTKTWIMMFQMVNKNLLTTIDGRVDPAVNQVDPKPNTMLLLNWMLWKQDYSDLPADAPAPLIQAMRTVR
jgi:hypothetical protein